MRGRRVLLVNPWIYDFAAYDLWAKPLGLLYLGSLLRRNGCEVELLDCLAEEQPRPKPGGHGKFRREIIEKPDALKDVPRHYARYGMRVEAFQARLSRMERPDVVLVTSLMTYWYPGVFEAIRRSKSAFPDSPVVLGGIYATLCHAHARSFSGADYVIAGEGEIEVLKLLSGLWGVAPEFVPDMTDLDALDYPCFDLVQALRYVCIQTSRGCPLQCTYCAAHLLSHGLRRRSPKKVLEELAFWNRRGVQDFAFSDDALLFEPEGFALPLLRDLMRRDHAVHFHCPNGLHVRSISQEVARSMKAAGFVTIRLGLETTWPERQAATGAKVTNAEFREAVENLGRAGYTAEDIGVYLLCGLPHQGADEVRSAIDLVKACGATPILAEYSPIPGTGLWEEAVKSSPFPISAEPLYQNNSILPCRWEGLTYAMNQDLMRRMKSNP